MAPSVLPRPIRRAGTVFVWFLVAVLAVLLLCAAWLGVRGFLAYRHLDDARQEASTIAAKISDPATASDAIASLSENTGSAHDLTSDPIWRAAETLPWIGPQLAAVSTVAAAADEVADDALIPLSRVASSFSVSSLRPVNGGIDVSEIASLEPVAAEASAAISRASASVTGMDTTALIGPVRTPVTEVATALAEASTGIDALSRATKLVPAMLGGDGPRNYLVVFQNNAEWRSLGGIVGAMAMIHTENGRMSLTAQGSSSDFRRFAEPVAPLTAEEVALFSNRPTLFIQNVTQIPDFTVAAPLAREMWKQENGTVVDGVIAIDPVALSYLLQATGPVRLASGDTLTADNAVSLLLNEVYLRYPRPSDQDAFFEHAAASVFGALTGGSADPAKLLAGLTRAGDENRLLLWNARPEDQAVLDGSTLQGTLPVTDATTTAFGVFLNDATGSKMDYYVAANAGATWCQAADGSSEAVLDVTLRNTLAPGTVLPNYITGGGTFGVKVGLAKTISYVYLPVGAEVVETTTTKGDGSAGLATGTHQGRSVVIWTTTLGSQQESAARVRVRTDRTPHLDVHMTPVTTGSASGLAPTCENAQ